jgi:hypothetical protein
MPKIKRSIAFGVDNIIDIVVRRKVRRKAYTLIAIAGRTGMGKSTLAFKIAKKHGRFRPKRDLIYDLDSFRRAMCDYDRTIVVDEAIYTTYKREWQKQGQIELIKQMNAYRDHKNLVILCIPNFWDLDKPLRELCHLRIDIIIQKESWAKGIVHLPQNSIYSQDHWDSYNNEKQERKFILGRSAPKFNKLSTYSGYIKFRPLSPTVELFYQKIKDEKRNIHYEKNMETNPDKKKDLYLNAIQKAKEGLLDEKQLLGVLAINGIEYNTFKSGVRNRLKSMGETRTFGTIMKQGQLMFSQSQNLLTQNLSKNSKSMTDFE